MIAAVAIFALLTLLISVVLFIIIKKPSSKVQELVDQIPGPPASAVFGNALQFKTGGPGIYTPLRLIHSK